MKLTRTHIITCLFILVCKSGHLNAQSIAFSRDSLMLETGSSFLSAVVTISNQSGEILDFSADLKTPPGWKVMNYSKHISLPPHTNQTIPFVLSKQRDAEAEWQPLVVTIYNEKNSWLVQDTAYLSCEKLSMPDIRIPEPSLVLTEKERHFAYNFQVRNNGNFKEKYFLSVTNQSLGIDYKSNFKLSPGSDSVFSFTQVNKQEITGYNNNERIVIEIVSETGKWDHNSILVTTIPQTITKHPSAFDQVAFNYETGLFAFNNNVTYYGSLKGSLDINKSAINFFYRTKQLGLANTVDDNIFGITLKRQKNIFYLGDITNTGFFYTRGLGISTTLATRRGTEFSASIIKGQKLAFLDGDLFVVGMKYKLPFKIFVEQKAFINKQQDALGRYIFHNDVQLVKNKLLHLSVNGGLGWDEQINNNRLLGTSWGYQADFKFKSLGVNSFVTENNKNYPGFGKARKDQRHNIKLQANKISFNAFFVQNSFLTNPFRDTIYLSDYLISNVMRYGLGVNYVLKKGYVSLAYGRAQSTMQTDNSLSKFRTIDFSGNFTAGKQGSIQISTLSGYDPGKEYGSIVLSTNSRISYINKFFGFSGFYIRTPIFEKKDGKRALSQYQETVNFGPSLNLNIYNNLHVQCRYQVQKSILDNELTQYMSGMINYTGRKNGLIFNLQFTNPITKSRAAGIGLNSSTYNLTVSKQFKISIPGTRKYHSLKIHLFSDSNLNGKQDEGELPLEGKIISIGQEKLCTNKDGNAAYKNLPPGNFVLDLSAAVKESYPAMGKTVEVNLEKNKTANIPFVPNKAIKGQVKLIADEYTNGKLYLGGLKVMATDSMGHVYSALADDNGNFHIYVPMGKFTVSLNADALGDVLKPRMAQYPVELFDSIEPFVVIELLQKKREIRFINK